MKHIKTFENIIVKPKFNIGNYVKIVTYINNENIWESPPYKIIRIDLPLYYLDTFTGGKIWRPEVGKQGESINCLEYVPNYEVAANKYNL